MISCVVQKTEIGKIFRLKAVDLQQNGGAVQRGVCIPDNWTR